MKNKGITLIALVITIIILLILAGIAISQLTENGLFNKTQVAKEKYNIEEEKERLEIEIANFKMQMYMNNNGKEMTLNDLKTYLDSEKFNGEYIVELFYEPLATTENVSVAPVYAKVTHVPTKFVFYVDGKLVVIGGNTEEEETAKAGVKLNKTNLNLSIGDSETLVATVQPSTAEQGISWSTSDSSIATVNSSGVVTAVSSGTATITATSTDDTSKKATCRVVVETLESIAIITGPTKTEYGAGENFDTTGMVVTATYESGNTKNVTSSVTVTPETLTTIGNDITVTISYTEGSITKTATTTVSVVQAYTWEKYTATPGTVWDYRLLNGSWSGYTYDYNCGYGNLGSLSSLSNSSDGNWKTNNYTTDSSITSGMIIRNR